MGADRIEFVLTERGSGQSAQALGSLGTLGQTQIQNIQPPVDGMPWRRFANPRKLACLPGCTVHLSSSYPRSHGLLRPRLVQPRLSYELCT